jgi:hypothetical protein
MKQLFATFREDDEEQKRLNIEAAKRSVNKTEAEKKLLIDEGFDDFVRGGQTRAPGIELAILGGTLLAAKKPDLALKTITQGANLIRKYPLRSLEVGLTGLSGASDEPQDIALETTGFKLDTMLGGPRPLRVAKLFNDVFPDQVQGGKRFFSQLFGKKQPVTPEGVEVPNTFFMSKSDDATGGLRDFSKVTSPEYKNIIISGMERMEMKDGIFDIDLYNKNSGILNAMADPLGGTVMKSGMRRGKKLTKRNWMEYFLSPESLKGNFESLRKEGKVAADLEWGDFLKSKGLTTQDIQVHHINPLYDSIHLFDGVKWGSDEYWEIISELIGSGARPGIVQRADTTNVIRTLGKSSLTDTPHGIAHAYYKDLVPTFFSKSERDLMKLDPGYRLQKAKEWSKIVNQSEDIVVKAHKAWEALNPKSRMPFDELIEQMAEYDNMGILKGVSIKYQVKDIQELVKQINFEAIIEPLPSIKFPNVSETKQRMLMYKAQPGVTWKMVKKKFPGFNYEQLDLFE